MRAFWQFDLYGVAWSNFAIGSYDAHYACLADEFSVFKPNHRGGHQAGLQAIQLRAGIAESGDFHDRRIADPQLCANGKPEQIEPACGNVFAHRTWCYFKPLILQLIMQFGMDQVHLTQVWLVWIARHPRPVLHGFPAMRIAFHTKAG
jgi:hypothetical protein